MGPEDGGVLHWRGLQIRLPETVGVMASGTDGQRVFSLQIRMFAVGLVPPHESSLEIVCKTNYDAGLAEWSAEVIDASMDKRVFAELSGLPAVTAVTYPQPGYVSELWLVVHKGAAYLIRSSHKVRGASEDSFMEMFKSTQFRSS